MAGRLILGVALMIAGLTAASQLPSNAAVDWPQWRGPQRNGLTTETGLLSQWPGEGPPRLWSVSTVGGGYGSVAVSGDRIFVQGSSGQQSVLHVLSRGDGKGLWSKPIGQAGSNDMGSGPRGTPTVDGDRVYVLTEGGDLACLRVQDGTPVWQRNILKDFRASNIGWLISESPLVDGKLLIVSPGGRNAGMVALDKMTGTTVWTSDLSDQAGYASAIAADVQGVRTIMTLTSEAGVGVRAADGKLMWKYPKVANGTANITTPVFNDDKVFFTSAYDTGGALLGLTNQGGQVQAKEIYFTRNMMNHHGGVVLVDGYLYGFHNSMLTCLEFATGKVMWRDRSVGKGSLVFADGHLYLQGENNLVGLAVATASGYREQGRFPIEDRGQPSWAHPVVSGGRLYIRNQATLTAYNIRAR
jgi:outer membrane protein assembly factor BamB